MNIYIYVYIKSKRKSCLFYSAGPLLYTVFIIFWKIYAEILIDMILIAMTDSVVHFWWYKFHNVWQSGRWMSYTVKCIAAQGVGKLLAHLQLARNYACCLNRCGSRRGAGFYPGSLCTAVVWWVWSACGTQLQRHSGWRVTRVYHTQQYVINLGGL